MRPVVMFVLAGRRPNMELQLPWVRDVLARHPNVEYHIWNLARTDSDRLWLPSIEGERITVFNDLRWCDRYDGTGFGYAPVYGFYTQPEFADHLFVKIDDDVVFTQSRRFNVFLEAVEAHRDHVVSACTVNNGACTPLIDGMWQQFEQLRVPLLDVHMSNPYADAAHNLFFGQWRAMLTGPVALTPTLDWLSINCIGYDYPMACHLSRMVGTAQPEFISDRFMREWGPRVGDEGIVNTLPRMVVQGFTACHLTFGPQRVRDPQARGWRERYRRISQQYLAGDPDDGWAADLPAPGEPQHWYPLARGDVNVGRRRSGDWRAKYRGTQWTRRRIIRAISGKPAVVRKVASQSEEQLAEQFRWMMACATERDAQRFAIAWAAADTAEAERAVVLSWWPDADTDYGLEPTG